MKRPLYVSTGALVGRVNGYDLGGALGIIADLYGRGSCRGLELMMLPAYYGRGDGVISLVRDCGDAVRRREIRRHGREAGRGPAALPAQLRFRRIALHTADGAPSLGRVRVGSSC